MLLEANGWSVYMMESLSLSTVRNVVLSRRGSCVAGMLILTPFHLVFSFQPPSTSGPSAVKEIWIAYPVIERMHKARGSNWMSITNSSNNNNNNLDNEVAITPPKYDIEQFDDYTASHIRIQCKDFTYYSFDFMNESICNEVFVKMSSLITKPKQNNEIQLFYAFDYKPNKLEQRLTSKGWDLYDPIREYTRLGLIQDNEQYWRVTNLNHDYRFCSSYPNIMIVPATISDNVLKHAGKFRSKKRIPAIVYRHRGNPNHNVISRCSQPLVGLTLLNRSIQDEKLILEIFKCQERERNDTIDEDYDMQSQPQKNLLVDLRPITNAIAQHALGAGTENIDNYRGKSQDKEDGTLSDQGTLRQVDKLFGNIDNIHVMRDSLTRLSTILNELDKYPNASEKKLFPSLQQALTKTQWLHRLSIVLQSVDRINKSIHLNNTNIVIHCSDGWDRTSQVSALSQLCLDPYYRTIRGFMVLIEKEWISFGFKFATRGDHGGCIGALLTKKNKKTTADAESLNTESSESIDGELNEVNNVRETNEPEIRNLSNKAKVASFLQRAANHVKNAASNASSTLSDSDLDATKFLTNSVYNGSNERSPIFHQFLDCVFQILRQHPNHFEFNSRFLKRLFYHYYSCQYGTFLCDTERELKHQYSIPNDTVSVWDYFNSRPQEFTNKLYKPTDDNGGVIFFNYTDIKWWFELYGRTDSEMNGLSNSLDKKFAEMNLNQLQD